MMLAMMPLMLAPLVAALVLTAPPQRLDGVDAKVINVRPGPGDRIEAAQIVAAVAEARASLAASPRLSVLLQLPAGEFAINTTETPFELSDIAPAAGALLTIAGAGAAQTVLRFDGLFDVIRGRNASRVRFADLTFARQRLTTTQGVVVAADATSVTLQIQDDYPLPLEIMGDPERLQPGAGRWMRRYRQAASGDCELVTDREQGTVWPPTQNVQVKWLNATIAGGPRTWKLGGVSWTFGPNSEPVYSKGDVVGIKSKHGGQAFFFDGGSNISFVRTTWTEHSRGVLRGGISDITFEGTAVRKSSLAPSSGLPLCLATPGGGPQLGQPDDGPIHNIVVKNHSSASTGDDAIACFNVKSGEISGSNIADAFARGIYLYKSSPTLSENRLQRCPVWHDNRPDKTALKSDDPYAVMADGGYQTLSSSDVNHWVATSSNGTVSVPATVPGQIQLDLRRAGLIEDTYKRFDQELNAWVYRDHWQFQLNFTVDPSLDDAEEVWLVFDGVDTLGRIYLNEAPPSGSMEHCFRLLPNTLPNPRLPNFRKFPGPVGMCEAACVVDPLCAGVSTQHAKPEGSCWLYHNVTAISNGTGFRDGDWREKITPPPAGCTPPPLTTGFEVKDQFLRYKFPVRKHLRSGVNSLTVQLESVANFGAGGIHAEWTHVRKEPSNFGYDWSPIAETQGIWMPCYLVGQTKLMLLDMAATVHVDSSSSALSSSGQPGSFEVKVVTRLNLTAAGSVQYTVGGNWSSTTSTRTLHLPAGVSEVVDKLPAKDVELWWPAGYGSQTLYAVDVSAVVSSPVEAAATPLKVSRRVGFRSVAMDTRCVVLYHS
jgi:hypothetical protein